MLENVVESHNIKIASLEEELKSCGASSSSVNCKNCENDVKQFKCKECDFVIDIEIHMELHKEKTHKAVMFVCEMCDYRTSLEENLQKHEVDEHAVECNFCEETFYKQSKLEKHICRVKIPNPEYWDMYMKNWYIRDTCIPVFSRKLKKEIILLHNEHCWENGNPCAEFPQNLDKSEKSFLDTSGLLHIPAIKSGTLLKNGSIYWLALRCVMDKLVDYEVICK